jgi:hypothetical protein
MIIKEYHKNLSKARILYRRSFDSPDVPVGVAQDDMDEFRMTA